MTTQEQHIQWQNKARHLPIFLIRHGSATIKPLSLNLTLRSCWSTYTRQKRRFSTVCKSWHKAPTAQTIKVNGRPLKMLSQAFALSRGTILGFLIGKRSKESRGNVVEQSAGFADQNRHVLGL